MGHDLQSAVFEQLDAALVRAREFDRGGDNLRKHDGELLDLHGPGADLLHAGHGRQFRGQLRIQRLDRRFRALAFRNIAGDLRSANDAALSVLHGGNGEGNVDQRAVLPPAHGLEMLNALAAFETREDFGLLVLAIGGDEQSGNGLAYRFRGRIAENPFGALVPTCDNAVKVLTDNRVVGGIDDGA